jgi:hypothetical protein
MCHIQLGNRLLVESKDGNTRFGVLVAAIAFQANWRKWLRGLDHLYPKLTWQPQTR